MKIEEKIYLIRKKQGLSQEEFADKLDVSRQAVHKWEAGTTLPEIDKIKTISKLFNVSFDYLMNDEIEEMVEPEVKEVKKTFKPRPLYYSKKTLNIGQGDIDNGYLENRKAKLKTVWLPTRQSKVKKNLASVGITNIMFVPHFSATAFFYDLKKKIMGFYYAGEIQFICPFENIVNFNFKQDGPTTTNSRVPITNVGFSSSGISSVGVGSMSMQTSRDSTMATATLSYKNSTGKIEFLTLNFSVASLYLTQDCKDVDELHMLYTANMGALLNTLGKISAHVNSFIQTGREIVNGSEEVENYEISLYTNKNKEFIKDYNFFILAVEEETKKNNIAHLIGRLILWGVIIGIAIFLISFIIEYMDSIVLYL